MNLEEKYKMALFGVIRNGKVMPELIGKEEEIYINAVSYNTMLKIMDMIDFERMEQEYLEGKKQYENALKQWNKSI